jgi:hypothetical protein
MHVALHCPATRRRLTEIQFVEEYKRRIFQEREVNRGEIDGDMMLPFVSQREREAEEEAINPKNCHAKVWHGRQKMPFNSSDTVTNLFADSEWHREAKKVRQGERERLRQLKRELRDERRLRKELEARQRAPVMVAEPAAPAAAAPAVSSYSAARSRARALPPVKGGKSGTRVAATTYLQAPDPQPTAASLGTLRPTVPRANPEAAAPNWQGHSLHPAARARPMARELTGRGCFNSSSLYRPQQKASPMVRLPELSAYSQ